MKTIVCFHIGRGGRFNNQGYKSFMADAHSLQDLISRNDLFIASEDPETGEQLPDSEWRAVDGGSNVILRGRDAIEAETGVLEFDMDYDTDIAKYIDDCDEEEIELLLKAYYAGERMSSPLMDEVCALNGLRRAHAVRKFASSMSVSCQEETVELSRDTFSVYTREEAAERLRDEMFDELSIEMVVERMETAEWLSEE